MLCAMLYPVKADKFTLLDNTFLKLNFEDSSDVFETTSDYFSLLKNTFLLNYISKLLI
mgnify:CR=1 FL=1